MYCTYILVICSTVLSGRKNRAREIAKRSESCKQRERRPRESAQDLGVLARREELPEHFSVDLRMASKQPRELLRVQRCCEQSVLLKERDPAKWTGIPLLDPVL